jgi:uncharacterized protein YjbJ (UPF0337 family)
MSHPGTLPGCVVNAAEKCSEWRRRCACRKEGDGLLKEALGKITGNPAIQAEGAAEKTTGKEIETEKRQKKLFLMQKEMFKRCL